MKPSTRCFSSSFICSCASSIGESSTRTSVTAEPERRLEGRKAGQQDLTRQESRCQRENCGRFRQEISGGERFLWKSQLLFYSLPADFQQVFTIFHRSGQESLPID